MPGPDDQLNFTFDATVTPRGDGSYILKPGKPIGAATYLKPKEVAALLRVSVRHVYNLVDEGKLAAVNLGGGSLRERRYLRIPRTALDTFLAGQAV